jgi:DNA polymerase-1
MRSLWVSPKNRLLVGVDAEGIQLRIFAHYINDPEFTDALVNGKKEDKSDPHSLNQRILGAKSRAIAKRFIFAFLLGGGIGKLAQILELSENEGKEASGSSLGQIHRAPNTQGNIIPADAKRGWFYAIDGRPIPIPGDTVGERKHLCMSGYLQSGEVIVVKGMAVSKLETASIGSIQLPR